MSALSHLSDAFPIVKYKHSSFSAVDKHLQLHIRIVED
jgi:hypothetical protein